MWRCGGEDVEIYVDVQAGVYAEVHVDKEVDVDADAAAVLVVAEVVFRGVSDSVDVGVGADVHTMSIHMLL